MTVWMKGMVWAPIAEIRRRRHPDGQIRKLVEFVGLPWDDACLRPQLSTRVVQTASYHQVKRPIYRHAAGRAQHYAKWRQPLRDALHGQGP